MGPTNLVNLNQHDQALMLGYNSLMRTLIATLTALILFVATPVVAENLIDAINAEAAGDSQKAAKILESLAKQGNAAAQGMLGIMYSEGQGVAWNFVNGYAWLSIAAAQTGALDDRQALLGYIGSSNSTRRRSRASPKPEARRAWSVVGQASSEWEK
jgi:TPR repeat protein